MIDCRRMAAALAFTTLLAVNVPAVASNLAAEPERPVTPHQELMTFLLRGPATPDLLAGKRVAMIVVNGADAVTFQLARDYLTEQGAVVDVLTPRSDADAADSLVSTWDYAGNERLIAVTAFLDESDPGSYALVYLPGSHPDMQSVEANAEIARYTAHANAAGKAVFAVGDAALVLARSNLLRGRHATGARNLQVLLAWSGVEVKDEPLVRDSLIYTSRDAFDLPRMMQAMEQVLIAP